MTPLTSLPSHQYKKMSSTFHGTESSLKKGLIAIELPLDELKPKFTNMDFVIFTEQYSGFLLILAERSLLFLVSCVLCLINIYLFAYGEYVHIKPEHISS